MEEGATREELEKEKAELLEKLKEADRRYKYKMYEAKALHEMLERKKGEGAPPPAREIRRRIGRLEFLISTEARTLKQERELVKEVRNWEKKLKEAVEFERMERRLRFVEEDMKKAEGEVEGLEKRINEIRNQLKERRKLAKESKLLELKRRVEEERRKEIEPFLQREVDGKVNLGEICVIKKKEK